MLGNLLPLGLLLIYGVAFAWRALGTSPMVFDDHPGQLYRVWHVVTHGPAPWAWNAGWWTGYPELQFYPPGFAYAGALLHVASGGAASIAGSYQALVWLAYLAPAVTVWLTLRRLLGDGWLALPGAFVALTLSAGLSSGVEGGVHIGMIGARLGWAALPLLPLALSPWLSGRSRFPWIVVPLVAGIVLVHPAHLPAAVVLVALAGALATSRPARLGSVAAALILAAGLSAFWTVPLLIRAEHTRALAWGSLSVRAMLGDPLLLALAVLAAVGAALPRWRRRPTPPDEALLSSFPWAMVVVVLLDALALEPLGLRWLPADRVVDSAWLGFVLSGGATAGRLIAIVGHRQSTRAGLAVVAVALVVLLGRPAQTLTLWPVVAEWPRLETIRRGMRLDALWATLRAAPAGRVLFARSSVPLAYGAAHWRLHSHVTALTPMLTGRAIVNGTFTHPSPTAALVYRGDAGRGAIRELVEMLDGRRLFGRDLDELDTETFNGLADRLGISAVVVLDEDVPRLRALRDNPLFARAIPSAPFVIFTRPAPIALPEDTGPGRLRLSTNGANTWVPARVAYYPLWRAIHDGQPIPVRRGALGDLEIRVPATPTTVDLVYQHGGAETAGLAITAAALAALAAVWATGARAPRDR